MNADFEVLMHLGPGPHVPVGDFDEEIQEAFGEVLHGRPGQEHPRVEVRPARFPVIDIRIGGDPKDRRRKSARRASAGGEDDDVAARRDLSGDPDKVVSPVRKEE